MGEWRYALRNRETGDLVDQLLKVQGETFDLGEIDLTAKQVGAMARRGLVESCDGAADFAVDRELVETIRAELEASDTSIMWWPVVQQTDGAVGCCHGGLENLTGDLFSCRMDDCDARYDRETAIEVINGEVEHSETPWRDADA